MADLTHTGDSAGLFRDTGLGRRGSVYDEIRFRLISGGYHPGEKIKLRPLAEELNTSVTPVREALLQLVTAGTLEHSLQKSIRVPEANWHVYKEVRELRILIESRAAAYAAARIPESAIEQMEALTEQLDTKSPADLSLHRERLVEFHFELYRHAGKPVSLKLIESLWLQSGPYLSFLIPEYLPLSKSPSLRVKICSALRRRDGMAVAEAIETDLRNALGYLLERFT
ncbi:GntR family transcriptional regulator [Sinorhizobium americanum]|uniref:GntR family transcriptional regulator n=1 Tax=Sinorhizobium americanum TaxID=194963 RepID=UPI0007D98B76|nr:GntR family transcriptional regulator [Sinorhizobium americanum]OAP45521.1 hypothetical protein ATC00_24335 [Sinorhizobium americanum]